MPPVMIASRPSSDEYLRVKNAFRKQRTANDIRQHYLICGREGDQPTITRLENLTRYLSIIGNLLSTANYWWWKLCCTVNYSPTGLLTYLFYRRRTGHYASIIKKNVPAHNITITDIPIRKYFTSHYSAFIHTKGLHVNSKKNNDKNDMTTVKSRQESVSPLPTALMYS